MHHEAISRRDLLRLSNRLAGGGVAVSGPNLALLGMGQGLTRRELLAGTIGLFLGSNPPTMGEQSFPWMPAGEDYRTHFDSFDQLDRAINGQWAFSSYPPHGSTGDLIQRISREEAAARPNGLAWTGWCKSAGVAAWCLPALEDRIFLDGQITIPWQDQLFIGTIFCAYGNVEREWGRLNFDTYAEIQSIHQDLRQNQTPKALVVDTSDYRGFPGQQWWGCIHHFEGSTINLTSFLEVSEINSVQRKPFLIPFNRVTKVQLIDPLIHSLG